PGLCIDLTDAPDGVKDCLVKTQQMALNPLIQTKVQHSMPMRVSESQSSSLNIKSVIRGAKEGELSDPVEVLKYLQKEIVAGRPLEVTSSEDTIEGETNYITVDRDNIIETTYIQLQYISNYRLTFQVDFMGEECIDYGGPRREWIRLMNQAIKQKYSDHSLRPSLTEDYFNVGIMMAIAMLQNGQLPWFVEEDILQQIVSEGMCLDPSASRRVCGKTTLNLSHILQFATGSPEEPVLGFTLAASLKFILPTELKDLVKGNTQMWRVPGFLPLAHTCTNLLQVPRPTDALPLPSTQRLFALYDLAFSQCYCGKK
ncbi:unnamed protein product, partial [Porites lobata]